MRTNELELLSNESVALFKHFQKGSKGFMQGYYQNYCNSNDTQLSDCYGSYSYAKGSAFKHCLDYADSFGSNDYRILSYNCNIFTFGFVAMVEGVRYFLVITPTKNRYIRLDSILKSEEE